MSNSTYINYMKKIALTCIMALVYSLVGFIINQFSQSITSSFTQFIPISKSMQHLNSYERQINDTKVNSEDIRDRLDFIGGLSKIKDDIQSNILLPLKHAHIFFSKESNILRPSRGILFYGPPGTGKTMLARAIAAEANVPFLSLSLSVLENKFYGESNKLIQATFSLARKLQPCIIFFDEIDGLMKQRHDSDQSSVYGFKTEMLAQMDGMGSKETDSFFIIGTTNNLTYLDAALKRRLPKHYEVALPSESERYDILKLKTSQESVPDQILKWVASIAENASGSDLSDIVRQAASFRLQDQCQNSMFKEQLENAKCFDDLHPLMILNRSHFEQALQMHGYTPYDAEEDEEAPPSPKK